MGTKTHRQISKLIEELKVNDGKRASDYEEEPKEPKRAMDDLVKVGEPAVKPLLALLKDASKYSCLYAIKVLGEIRDPRAAQPIIKAFSSKGFADAFELEYDQPKLALQKIGLPVLEPVLNYLEEGKRNDDVEGMVFSMRVLAHIKDEKAFKMLVNMLSYPNDEVKDWAIESLAEYRDKRAIDRLSRFLLDSDFRDSAKSAIRRLIHDPKEYRNILAARGIVGERRMVSFKEEVRPLIREMESAYTRWEKRFEGDDAEHLNNVAREYCIKVSIENLLGELAELAVDEGVISIGSYKKLKMVVLKLREILYEFTLEHKEERAIIFWHYLDWPKPDAVKEEKRSYKGIAPSAEHLNLNTVFRRVFMWLKERGFLVAKHNRDLWARKGTKDGRRGCFIEVRKDEERPRTWGLVHIYLWGEGWTKKEAEIFTGSFWQHVDKVVIDLVGKKKFEVKTKH